MLLYWWLMPAQSHHCITMYIEPEVAGMLLYWWLMPARSHHCIKKSAGLQVVYACLITLLYILGRNALNIGLQMVYACLITILGRTWRCRCRFRRRG